MYGTGLLKGLAVTIRHFFSPKFTEQYPEERPNLPPASHGFFAYDYDKCIACKLCERACPNQVIHIETEKDENNKNKVTKYDMDISYCLYCGLCIEACPTQALLNARNFEISVYHREGTDYDFLEALPHDMNVEFERVQKDYFDAHPAAYTVDRPKAEKPAQDPNAPKPKPKAAPAKAAADPAKPADQAASEKPAAGPEKEGEA